MSITEIKDLNRRAMPTPPPRQQANYRPEQYAQPHLRTAEGITREHAIEQLNIRMLMISAEVDPLIVIANLLHGLSYVKMMEMADMIVKLTGGEFKDSQMVAETLSRFADEIRERPRLEENDI